MFRKNILFCMFLELIAGQTVFSQSATTGFNADYINNGLILYKSGTYYENDYTSGDRAKMGVLNMFFGLGSFINGHKSGGWVTAFEIIGIGLVYVGSTNTFSKRENRWDWNTGNTSYVTTKSDNTMDPAMRKKMVTTGYLTIAGGILLGYLIPLAYHKPGATKVSQNDFPFNIELAAAKDGEINGLRLCYNLRY